MGFLKEFWDKKFKGKDQEDEADGSVNIQVAGRAQSEYFPSNGRQAQR